MATTNSTATPSIEVKSNALSYFDFSSSTHCDIYEMVALSRGVLALVETSEWENDEGLVSAINLLCQLRNRLESLAEKVDLSTLVYGIKSNI